MTIRFERPAGAAGAYEFTAAGALWKISVPKGGWCDVDLVTESSDKTSGLTVLSNNSFVSPRNPSIKLGNIWRTTYSVFGQNVGVTMLEAKDQLAGSQDSNAWPIVANIQAQVVDSGSATAPQGSVELRFNSASPTVRGGDYSWPTQFVLKNADASTNGFILQKVMIGFESADPRGKSEHDFWWEAWRVANGRVYSGLSKTMLSLGDTANSSNTGGFKGTQWHRCEAKFMPNYTEPEQWGLIRERAGSLPATRTLPPGWASIGATRRAISVDFDGTVSPPTSSVTFLMENY
jgi:hypothetical protein